MTVADNQRALASFHPAVREWFEATFAEATPAQALGWPPITRGDSTLLLAPTGSGKTLAAFLHAIDRLMFRPTPGRLERCRVLYVSPLKALAVDVERNLRMPLQGIAALAEARGDEYHRVSVSIRTGDTPAAERARIARRPPDILITTPESLYLMLTSQAREGLRSVEAVIIDEIHALVPTKRGSHLGLSLERLQALRSKSLQRIGLSATQRPLEEVARFLGGVEAEAAHSSPGARPSERPVTIVDAGRHKPLALRIEVPVEDMARLPVPAPGPDEAAGAAAASPSIWTAIHPRLLELVREHRSTLLFVNSRRVAERLAGALNELAGEVLVQAHHGSVARAQRLEIEENLKLGRVRGLVATSSLELGIDMGAIDLVVQIEAPPSVASGMQRIGRAGHQVGASSSGVIFPKYRADLVACAALTRAMHEGQVEPCRYPRNPLDVLAQQVVAMAAMEPWSVDDLYATVRRAAPFAELGRATFESVLDMLAGRYVSDDFAELRPRLTWDRLAGTVTARQGARRVAVVNGGTIPDRGLYGVFLTGGERRQARVGELDEEMVFESRVGETFVLGASSWRIEEITHDRVLVSPAPGQPGKMPFWRGEAAGRPLEMGRLIGKLVRELREAPRSAALARLVRHHDLDERAAENLVAYLEDQAAATDVPPDDQTVVIECCRDELGDWRICVLSPLGGKVHAPWSMAVQALLREQRGLEVETLWADDGFVIRVPESDQPPSTELLIPGPDEVEGLVLGQLGSTALFASHFREVAGRALLLPKRRPGGRTPLWQRRKRSADLLAVASGYPSFPMVLETYRECLRDVFDMDALEEVLRDVASRKIRVHTVTSQTPSPFASSLLFGYVANYLYDGDAPLAERRAQALAIDHAQLRELLGDVELRELLDAEAAVEMEARLQHLDERYWAHSSDGLHDLLLRLGDLSEEEVSGRCPPDEGPTWLEGLAAELRAIPLLVAGQTRYVAVEDVARYRDGLGATVPPGLPEALLTAVPDPLGDLVRRYARTHGPFTADEVALRYGLAPQVARSTLERLVVAGRLLEGAFRPGGSAREWCDPEVLSQLRRSSLAKLRHEVEPVEPPVLCRMLTTWQGVTRPGRGLDALLDAIERLQGMALPASVLETEILPARVDGYDPSHLDSLAAAGEVVWRGVEALGERDGRVALYLTDHLAALIRPEDAEALTTEAALAALPERERALVAFLRAQGASFFQAIHEGTGGGFPGDTVGALWGLVWRGFLTNDTFRALRAYRSPSPAAAQRDRRAVGPGPSRNFRSRRVAPPAAEGRWALLEERLGWRPTPTEWSANLAQQLLGRYGIVTREVAQAECIAGGFSAIYEVMRTLEDAGRIRRGYFVGGIGAMQFAAPAALELLRSQRPEPDEPRALRLAATDPANPYGSLLRWPALPPPEGEDAARTPQRAAGAVVLLVGGSLRAYLSRGGRQLLVWLPEDEPDRSRVATAVAAEVAALAQQAHRSAGVLIAEINGVEARRHDFAAHLATVGFASSSKGLYRRRERGFPSPRRRL